MKTGSLRSFPLLVTAHLGYSLVNVTLTWLLLADVGFTSILNDPPPAEMTLDHWMLLMWGIREFRSTAVIYYGFLRSIGACKIEQALKFIPV
jgi:hypothetical protein